MYTIITRDNCKFCDDAKSMLLAQKIQVVIYNVQSPSSRWLLTLMRKAGLTTVPQIFNSEGEHIGGYSELRNYVFNNNPKEF